MSSKTVSGEAVSSGPGPYHNAVIKLDRFREQKKGTHTRKSSRLRWDELVPPSVVWGWDRSVAGRLGSRRSGGAGQVVALGRAGRSWPACGCAGQPRRSTWKRSATSALCSFAGLVEQRLGHRSQRQAEPIEPDGRLQQLLADAARPAAARRPIAVPRPAAFRWARERLGAGPRYRRGLVACPPSRAGSGLNLR